jgi:hypothetical protein
MSVGAGGAAQILLVFACPRLRVFLLERRPQMDASITRRLALYELLEKPDPPELHRGFVVRLPGKPDRYAQLPELAAAFVRRKMDEIGRRTPPLVNS